MYTLAITSLCRSSCLWYGLHSSRFTIEYSIVPIQVSCRNLLWAYMCLCLSHHPHHSHREGFRLALGRQTLVGIPSDREEFRRFVNLSWIPVILGPIISFLSLFMLPSGISSAVRLSHDDDGSSHYPTPPPPPALSLQQP